MKQCYDKRATEQPSLGVSHLVMLNAKNIHTKRPSKKLSPNLYGPLKVLARNGSMAYKLEISPRWKIHPGFHISLSEPYRALNIPNLEQPPRDPEDIVGDLEFVGRIVKSEIISYTQKVRPRNKPIHQVVYFVKLKGWAEDENTWEPPEGMKNALEEVERFYRDNPEIPSPREVE